MATRRTSDDPTLAEAARRLVLPEGIVSSAAPAVLATCVRLGLPFDRWQAGAAKGILAKNAAGEYAADTVALSIPRQVGKTYLIGAIAFALCLIRPGFLVLWSAHRFKTAKETFAAMSAMAERPLVKRHVKRILTGEGSQSIEFHNGSRILFGARERGFGRGFAKVGMLVFDEAQILTSAAIDDMIPATLRAENPLIVYLGTPPKPDDPGEHFTMIRREAIGGESVGTFYVELAADPDADSNDRAAWRRANPSYPRHVNDRAMLRVKKNLTDEAWRLEGLGIWPEDEPGTLPRWSDRRVDGMPVPAQVVVGVAASSDGRRASIAAAGEVFGVAHVGVVDRREGTAWLVDELLAMTERRPGLVVAVRSKGALSDMLESFVDAGIHLVEYTEAEWVDACGAFARRVEDGSLIHANHPALNGAVTRAVWRKVGDRRAIAEGKTGEVSMLEAAVLAVANTENIYNVLSSAY